MSIENRSIQRCLRCGRPLTSEASLDRKYGLTCWNKVQYGDREQDGQDKQKSLNDFLQDRKNEGATISPLILRRKKIKGTTLAPLIPSEGDDRE
jgi:hypothetical protein